MKKTIWIVTLSLVLSANGVEAAELIQLLTLKTHSQLVIGVDESVAVERKNSNKGFELLFKGISLSDLSESDTNTSSPFKPPHRPSFKNLKDRLVDSIAITEDSDGVRITGK